MILADDLRPGQHLAVLGADGQGKAELEPAAISRCRLFCDEWKQASTGGELAAPSSSGEVDRDAVGELGPVLLGQAPGRQSPEEITLFDSTGLAIQDLGIVHAVMRALEEDRIESTPVAL